ncbi:MAG: aminodeoxychorismate synthase component I [Gammaproteobacteria bacterium]|nr:aminodeoxychorismate synthase component I [Gammaproteobacteria bacterium]
MSAPMRERLPYCADSAAVFERLVDERWPVFIDSARTGGPHGRYDILAADPMITLVARGAVTEIRTREGQERSEDDPFALLRGALGEPVARERATPFCGGAIGYFAYDLVRRIERLPALAADVERVPEMAVGIYDWALVVDHARGESWLVGQGHDPSTHERWHELAEHLAAPPQPAVRRFRVGGPVRSNMDRAMYAAAFRRIKEYIAAGDCYQVNLAQRFSVPVAGDPWVLYRLLRRSNPAPFSAYLANEQVAVLSASPERFLHVADRQVMTKPVKGTRPRGRDAAGDARLAEELRCSAKDRAENLMIVDLLRNDIGKTCAVGSVRVPKLFDIESFATVHHMVSTITGTLAPGKTAADLLRDCFPGGSITGAPKVRAMEIIEELEPNRRGIYCGAIGYISFDGTMDTNIAIRTLVCSEGVMRFWGGGGIVHDSEVEAEYQETFDKVAAMLRLLAEPALNDGVG